MINCMAPGICLGTKQQPAWICPAETHPGDLVHQVETLPASQPTLHPTWPVHEPGTLPLGSLWHRVEVSWRKAAGQPSDRQMLHFTRGGKVNTNVAFSESLLTKSTRKSPLTSADTGLGWCLVLLRLICPSFWAAKQDTPARTHPSGADTSLETAAQRSASALGFSTSWFPSKPNTKLRNKPVTDLQSSVLVDGDLLYGSNRLATLALMGGDSSRDIPEGEMPLEKFRTWPLRRVRWRFIFLTSYQGSPCLPIIEIHFDIFPNST